MRYRHIVLAIALLAGATVPRRHSRPTVASHSASYPENWNDTWAEKKLYICESQRGRYYVKIGTTDAARRTLISLVPFTRSNTGEITEDSDGVLRVWLDKDQTARLRDGKYMATIVPGRILLDPRQHRPRPRVPVGQRAPSARRSRNWREAFKQGAGFTVLGNDYLSCDPAK